MVGWEFGGRGGRGGKRLVGHFSLRANLRPLGLRRRTPKPAIPVDSRSTRTAANSRFENSTVLFLLRSELLFIFPSTIESQGATVCPESVYPGVEGPELIPTLHSQQGNRVYGASNNHLVLSKLRIFKYSPVYHSCVLSEHTQ